MISFSRFNFAKVMDQAMCFRFLAFCAANPSRIRFADQSPYSMNGPGPLV